MNLEDIKFANGYVDHRTRRPLTRCDQFKIEGNVTTGDGVDTVYYETIVQFVLTTSDETFSEMKEVERVRDVRKAILDLTLEVLGNDFTSDEIDLILERDKVYEYFEDYTERKLGVVVSKSFEKEYFRQIDTARVENQR